MNIEDIEKVKDLVLRRNQARRFRNFEEADRLREELIKMGCRIDDQETKTQVYFYIKGESNSIVINYGKKS